MGKTQKRCQEPFIDIDDDADYKAFEMVLQESVERTKTRLLAYCLMPNHWHLVVWPRDHETVPDTFSGPILKIAELASGVTLDTRNRDQLATYMDPAQRTAESLLLTRDVAASLFTGRMASRSPGTTQVTETPSYLRVPENPNLAGSGRTRAVAVYDPEFAAGQLRLAGQAEQAVAVENSYGLWKRGSFRKATYTNAVSEFTGEDGVLRCLCGDEIPATTTVMRKGVAVERIGYDLDHYKLTWAQRRDIMQQLPIPVTRDLVKEIFNMDVRPLHPPCNQGHTFEGR